MEMGRLIGLLAIWMNLPNNWVGAWTGGVIDNTGAVVAAGTVVGGEAAVQVASVVKLAQNVLIGVVAFLLAIWATMTLDRQNGAERSSFTEI